MKIEHLKRELRKNGAVFIIQGGDHEKWKSANGYRFTVPRHPKIDECLALKNSKTIQALIQEHLIFYRVLT